MLITIGALRVKFDAKLKMLPRVNTIESYTCEN